MWMLSLVCLLVTQGDSAIVFLNGNSNNTSVFCATANKLLGPQAKESTTPVIAELFVLRQPDPCIIDTTSVARKIVYLTVNGACADEKIYENLYARGAVAVIRSTDFVPGSDYYLGNSAARLHPTWNTVPFVEISENDVPTITDGHGAIISLFPDASPWQPVYSSAFYQTFLRWIPSLIAFVAFCLAVSFLSQHLRILRIKYLSSTPADKDTTSNWILFFKLNANASVVVLAIEAFSSIILMLVWSVGGFWSTSNLPAPVVRFFATQLSGLAYVTTILSAHFWHKIVAELKPSAKPGAPKKPPSLLKRVFRGKVLCVNVIILCGPLLLDFILAIQYAAYKDREYPSLVVINALIFVLIDIVLAVYFLRGSITLQIHMDSLLRRTPGHGRYLRVFRMRTIRCVSGLGICMLLCSAATLTAGLAPDFYSSPVGWTVCWTMFTNARILQSLFHIIMFRPTSRSDAATTPSPGEDLKSTCIPGAH